MYTMSIDKKKFKRLDFLCKAFELEKEMFEELDKEYGCQFSKDFRKENEFLIINASLGSHTNVPSEIQKPEDQGFENSQPDELLKKLHRALARITHPDVMGNEEEFKVIQQAYENNDAMTLVMEIFKRNLDINLDTQELKELEKKLENQKIELLDMKNTLRWVWAESKKNEKLRDVMRINLGINPKKFKEWIVSLSEKEGK